MLHLINKLRRNALLLVVDKSFRKARLARMERDAERLLDDIRELLAEVD